MDKKRVENIEALRTQSKLEIQEMLRGSAAAMICRPELHLDYCLIREEQKLGQLKQEGKPSPRSQNKTQCQSI